MLEALTADRRKEKGLISERIIEIFYSLGKSAVFLIPEVCLIQHEHRLYVVSLRRSHKAVDKGSRSRRIRQRRHKYRPVDIGRHDMALLGEIRRPADYIVLARMYLRDIMMIGV